MSKRSLEHRVYTPDDLNILSKAFRRACAECDLTGPAGQRLLARTMMSRFKNGVTKEDDLVDVARIVVWRRRGLDGGLHVAPSPAKSRQAASR